MPNFTLNRNYVLRSLSGRSYEFRKGEPLNIPEQAVREAVAVGATPSDGSDPNVLVDEKVDKTPQDPTTRRNDIMAAMLKLINKSDRTDFTAGGTPHPDAITKIVGYGVQGSEIQVVWNAYCEQNAEDEMNEARNRQAS